MDKLKQNIDTLMEAARQGLANHSAEYGTKTPASGRDKMAAARRAVESYSAIVSSAYNALERLHFDDTLFPDGRKRMMQDVLTEAEEKIGKQAQVAEANATVARAAYIAEAMPKLSKGAELIARQDARMILDAADDVTGAMAQLARRQDDVGALVASQWGADYLTSRGLDERASREAAGMVQALALEAAASEEGGRSSAAYGALAAESLLGVNDAANGAAAAAVQEMRDHFAIRRPAELAARDPRRPAAPGVVDTPAEPVAF
jgi:hypothetical protein